MVNYNLVLRHFISDGSHFNTFWKKLNTLPFGIKYKQADYGGV